MNQILHSGLLILTFGIGCCIAYIPRFFHGRPKGGMIGSPDLHHLDYESQKLLLTHDAEEQWFSQKLDHFNPADTRRWQQRYFTSGVTDPEVMFVYIGGEGPADPKWIEQGAWIEYSKSYKTICFQLEHRYYGESHPTEDTSVANLKYLSSEQALADLAAFIAYQKRNTSAEKIIIFGGSYAACLAAWFRVKYPHLVDGAISSSAPLLAQVNFKGYLEVVKDSLDTYEPPGLCNGAISTATGAIDTYLQSEDGRKQLKILFNLCDDIDINEAKDISNLHATITDNWAYVVQYNKDNRDFTATLGSKSNITIDTVCDIMADETVGSELERYAAVSNLLLKTFGEECLDFKYQSMIDSYRNVSWHAEAAAGGRQWVYQTCIEFGYYQSSDSDEQPFGHAFPIDFWTQMCEDIYGPEFNASFIQQSVRHTNIDYGALYYTQDRVVFINGAIDPWHYLGITQNLPQAPAIFMQETAHCADLYPSCDEDPQSLTDARTQIAALIEKWITS